MRQRPVHQRIEPPSKPRLAVDGIRRLLLLLCFDTSCTARHQGDDGSDKSQYIYTNKMMLHILCLQFIGKGSEKLRKKSSPIPLF